MKNMTIAEAAWLAGIIDGEGSIFIMRQKRKDRERDVNYILRLTVESTDHIMAPTCKDITGEGEKIHQSSDARENCSDRLKWQVNGKKAVRVLQHILPYMKVKKDQAEAAISFQSTTKKHWRHMEEDDYKEQEKFYFLLKDLKQSSKIGKPVHLTT